MILKGSQRAGAQALSTHLMNERDNDHVTLLELRGFVSCNLHGALTEAYAISRATQCKQFMFSLSLNPPKDHNATDEEFLQAANQVEEKLGLTDQPRAIVIHEKEGRRHAHVVWSRIDADAMKAIELPFYKRKLMDVSRNLFLENGWKLPEGLQMNGGKSPLNFTLAEWQQAKRQDVDPREIKQVLQDAWQASDNKQSFQNALEDRGYFLAKGDHRGFVALDVEGNVYSLSRWVGIKSKELKAKLGDPSSLPSVDETKSDIKSRVTDQMRDFITEVKNGQKESIAPLLADRHDLKCTHNKERQQLKDKQDQRWQAEAKERSARLNKGVRGVFDWLSGKAKETKAQNEREAYQATLRDRKQRDNLINAQMGDKQKLQKQIDKLRAKHKQDRQILAANIAQSLRQHRAFKSIDHTQSRNLRLNHTLSI